MSRVALGWGVGRVNFMSDSISWGRQVDAELVEVVRLFRRRRKWRHIVAMTIGGVLLTAGSGYIAAHVTHHVPAGTPGIGVAGGLYIAGSLLFAWGAAAGFTTRLAKWVPATVVLGLLAVLALALAAVFSDSSDSVFHNGRGSAGTANSPTSGQRTPAPVGAHRVLAAELLTQPEVAQFLGPAPADLQTSAGFLLRSRSLALWRAAPPVQDGASRPHASQPRDSRRSDTLSLTVQYSPKRAGKLSAGQRPSKAQPVRDVAGGGYVRRQQIGSLKPVTRVRVGRGEWVVALQLSTDAAYDPTQQLLSVVAHVLDLLNEASRG